MAVRRLIGALLVSLAAALATALPADASSRRPGLDAFGSCGSLVDYARQHARRVRGGRGVPTRATPLTSAPLPSPIGPTVMGELDSTAPQPAAAAPVEGRDFSGTNVQEAGVDEPDVVKTDGRRLVAVADGRLQVLDVAGGAPRVVGSLALEGTGHQLLLRGDRLLVMAGAPGAAGVPATLLSEIDLTDDAAPAVRRTLTLPGILVDARQTGGTARVVVSSLPRPVAPASLPRAGVRTWVPRTVLRSRVSGRTFRRSVVPCDDVRRPDAFSGLDLLTVLTVDLDRGLYSVDRDAIMAGADTVYASPSSLYVASHRYAPGAPAGGTTEIHRFDTSRPDATTYRASGSVDGYVLNGYAMSEHDGALRVATTSQPVDTSDAPSPDAPASESAVTVLAERAGRLEAVGRVSGLGRGEQIFGVRFIGERGYVVTFRQTDPLYVIDLSVPSAPKVAGELKILGYSAYLHPITDDLLLGVGQDANETGARRGSQLSLFDVSDPRDPRRVARRTLGEGSSSAVEFDPHAFLYWRPTRLAAIPLVAYGDREPSASLAAFRVERDVLADIGRVEHPDRDGLQPVIGRSLVVGDRLYTVSGTGVAANRLDSLAPVAYVDFAVGPTSSRTARAAAGSRRSG